MPRSAVGYRLVQAKLAILTVLEWAAAAARRVGLDGVVDRVAPLVGRPFERFALDVDGVQLAGTELAHLHYVRELRELGREQTFVRLIAEAVPPGGTVLEGGAHLGFVTVHAARAAGPDGRVISFEANHAVLEVLRTNLVANGVDDRVEVVPKALGDAAGRARFYVRGGGEMSSLFPSAVASVPIEIEVVRADDEVAAPVDVVKLDIEGGESAALRGMEALLTGAHRPRALFLECNPELLERAGSSRDEVLAWLDGHGYSVEWIDEATGRTAPLSEPWSEAYVNLCCRRVS
jgi:FkbM family methyltransferase